MYRVLVTNDDGIESTGLTKLVEELSKLAIVYVVAPNSQQTAKSMALTIDRNATAEEVDMEGAEVAYAFDGTPVDCVKWGLGKFQGFVDFDYVISGINKGYNLSTATFYSGTVGAAREGVLSGIKSIALSVEHHDTEEFDYLCSILPQLFELSDTIGTRALLNVNAPDIPMWKISGVKIVEAAPHDYGDCYHFVSEDDKYKLEPYYSELDDNLDNDYNWLAKGYATVTPLSIELTDNVALNRLHGMVVEDPVCVFMDAQEDSLESMYKPNRWVRNISKWAKCVNRLDLPVLVTKQYGNGELLPEVVEGLDKFEAIDKVKFNAMDTKNFAMLVATSPDKTVYLAGKETHISIQQTALELKERGYKVVIIEDCCTAKSKQDHDIAIENMRVAGCHITSFDALIMERLGSNLHEAYGKVKEII